MSKNNTLDRSLYIQERINIALDELIKLADKLDKCPTVAEYESIKHLGYRRRDLEKNLNMKYNDICKKYIPKYKVNSDRNISKESIFENIKRMITENGGVMTFDEMKEKGLPYSYSLFESKCNMTFNQIISYLGYDPVGTTTISRSKEIMLSDFYNLFLELGRVPYAQDLNKATMANRDTYMRIFGSTENICKLLDIDYVQHYKGTGAGKQCLDNNGGKCRSYMECVITNFFIDNDIAYIKEALYKELIQNDTRRFDWKLTIDDKIYYVEYAGIYYPNKMYSGFNKNYVNKIDGKIKDLKDGGNYDKCLFIFPEDIKTKSLKEIFESFLGVALKETKDKYKITTIEYFNKTNEELLEIVMRYSTTPEILPSTGIISKKESGTYDEIRKRFKTYNDFALHFGKQTLQPYKKLVV